VFSIRSDFLRIVFLMVASIFSMPATRAGVAEVTRQAEVPLSDARRDLDRLTVCVARLRAEVEAAGAPVARLDAISAEHDRVVAEVQRLRGCGRMP
jgi:hypothetical protein